MSTHFAFPQIFSQRESPQTIAVRNFITDHWQDCYRFAYSQVKQKQTAEDIVQEAAAKALQHAHTLRNMDAVKPWFYRILLNEANTYFRKQKKLILQNEEPEPNPFLSENSAEQQVLLKLDLYKAVHQLPPELKTIIILRFWEDMKLSEIAQITQTNENTVKTRLRRALQQLQRLYEK